MLLTQKPQTKFVDFKLLKNVEWNSNVRKITMTKKYKIKMAAYEINSYDTV